MLKFKKKRRKTFFFLKKNIHSSYSYLFLLALVVNQRHSFNLFRKYNLKKQLSLVTLKREQKKRK
jgi:hypothetical protein